MDGYEKVVLWIKIAEYFRTESSDGKHEAWVAIDIFFKKRFSDILGKSNLKL